VHILFKTAETEVCWEKDRQCRHS